MAAPSLAAPSASENARLLVRFGLTEPFAGCQDRPTPTGSIQFQAPDFRTAGFAFGPGASAGFSITTASATTDPCAGWEPGTPDPGFHTVETEGSYTISVMAEAEPGLARMFVLGEDLWLATLDSGAGNWEVPWPSITFRFTTSTLIDPLLPDPGIFPPAYAEGSLRMTLRAVPRFNPPFPGPLEIAYTGATGEFPNFVADIDAGESMLRQPVPRDFWDVYLTLDLAAGAFAVPEPATWAMLITGFGLVGATMRRRRRLAA